MLSVRCPALLDSSMFYQQSVCIVTRPSRTTLLGLESDWSSVLNHGPAGGPCHSASPRSSFYREPLWVAANGSAGWQQRPRPTDLLEVDEDALLHDEPPLLAVAAGGVGADLRLRELELLLHGLDGLPGPKTVRKGLQAAAQPYKPAIQHRVTMGSAKGA